MAVMVDQFVLLPRMNVRMCENVLIYNERENKPSKSNLIWIHRSSFGTAIISLELPPLTSNMYNLKSKIFVRYFNSIKLSKTFKLKIFKQCSHNGIL